MPYIKKSTIEQVFEKSDLVKVISKFVELKKKGATYVGKSPFSNERTGSFTVSPAKNIWKDFSSGKGGNSAISFIMQYKSLEYPDAIEYLAKELGVHIEYDDSEQAKKYQKKREKQEQLKPVMQAVVNKFKKTFERLPDDHPAKKEVFEKRKYDEQTAEAYEIGYAPGGTFIYDLCVEHGLKAQALELGLISDKGDKWVDRVIYPLHESKSGKIYPAGIAGRRLSDDDKYAKWMNSSISPLYKKDEYWYGLDKAREAIVKKGEAIIVEGYNDVISLQVNGVQNVIASSGTAINAKQVLKLRKLCQRVIFWFDPDDGGNKATEKYITQFFSSGFRALVISTKDDPDDFCRNTTEEEFNNITQSKDPWKDGIMWLLDKNLTNDPVDDGTYVRKICDLIAAIDDESMQNIYVDMIAKEADMKVSIIKSQLKDARNNVPEPETVYDKKKGEYELYQLPDEVKEPIEKLLPSIQRYQLFMANNRIYVQKNFDEPPYGFRSVSNFSISIIQHMKDEKFPSKLVRIKNVNNKEAVFDMPSRDMNQPNPFEDAMTNHGNYQWYGKRPDHQILKRYLFDHMNTGRRVDVLGWQPEGFWVWNNLVVTADGEKIDIDENGCFNYKDTAYYVPSANSIYLNNHYKFLSQKKFISIEPKVSFLEFNEQLISVHREHGMVALLFTIASIFQDICFQDLSGFPLLFLYGPASSGKDQLSDACQSFFGQPQTAINLEGKSSTDKAKIREFAQFANSMSQLSEYKPGNPDTDGILKGLWDRNGYKRGTIESQVSTESIPILSSTIMTGNFVPDQDALITRLVWNNMDKNSFSDDEVANFEKFGDIVKKGYSGFTNEFLKFRRRVEYNYTDKFRDFKRELSARLPEDTNSRMISNLSVLGSMYTLFKDDFEFSFTHKDITEHFKKIIELQMTKLKSASLINRFWDCFLASMRGTDQDKVKCERDFNVEGGHLYFQFTTCYNRIRSVWWSIHKENAPAKSIMSDNLKKDTSWVGTKDSHRFSPGRTGKNTSAFIIDMDKLPVGDELKYAIETQEVESTGQTNSFSPVTLNSDYDGENQKNKNQGSGLPF